MQGAHTKKYLIAVVGFFAVILMLTVLSRSLASFAVVEVKTATPSRQTISERLHATGTAQQRQEIAIGTESEQIIESIYVDTGDYVAAQEPLFKVRLDELAQKITQLEEDRHLVQLRIGLLSKQIEEAKAAALNPPSPPNPPNSPNPPDTIPSEDSNRGQDPPPDQSAPTEEGDEPNLQAMQAGAAAVNLPNNAMNGGSNNVQSPQPGPGVPTADTDELGFQLSSATIERNRLDRTLAGLYALREAGGIVRAPASGTISEVLARVGDMTMQGAVVRITDGSAGMKLVFSVSSEAAVHFGSNVAFAVINGATKETIEGVELASIAQNPLSPTLMDITLHLPEKSAALGATLEVSMTISSETYDTCIPLSALHQSSGAQYYVFVLDEERTVLGTELVARMVHVNVAATDNRWAAVDGLGGGQKVIVESAKMLADTDRVLVN